MEANWGLGNDMCLDIKTASFAVGLPNIFKSMNKKCNFYIFVKEKNEKLPCSG